MTSQPKPKHPRKERGIASPTSSKIEDRPASLLSPGTISSEEQAIANKWLAWNREQTRVVANGKTRAEAVAGAARGGEAEPVLENVEKTRRQFADLYAKGEDLRQGLLSSEGTPFLEAEVCMLLGLSAEEVEERREASLLLAVPVGEGKVLYPSWQFTGHEILCGFPEVLEDLRLHNRHPLAHLRFFLSRNLRLKGETPLAELRLGKVEEVRQAARCYGEQGAA